MARRRTKTKRRRSRAISALNILESYSYAAILSEGLAGTSPLGMITGKTDIYAPTSAQLAINPMSYRNPDQVVSLGDLVNQPSLAVGALQSNFMSNYQRMAVSAFTTRLAFKFGKKLLRQPISNINRNIMKPLGVGIKL